MNKIVSNKKNKIDSKILKIIFLDIDGVLLPINSNYLINKEIPLHIHKFFKGLEKERIYNIISSTWIFDLIEMYEFLSKEKIKYIGNIDFKLGKLNGIIEEIERIYFNNFNRYDQIKICIIDDGFTKNDINKIKNYIIEIILKKYLIKKNNLLSTSDNNNKINLKDSNIISKLINENFLIVKPNSLKGISGEEMKKIRLFFNNN